MSVGGFDIELNGVKYNLAEDAEGDHYVDSGEPLRPPNAVTVQGEGNRQVFQMRPDVIKWSLTDWSGGEGQVKYNPQAPNRWRELTGVRVFEKPGTVRPGYYVEDTYSDPDAGDLDHGGLLSVGGHQNNLLMFPFDHDSYYGWEIYGASADQWGLNWSGGRPAASEVSQPVGFGQNVYWLAKENADGTGSDEAIWGWGDGSASSLVTTVPEPPTYLAYLNGSLYWWRLSGANTALWQRVGGSDEVVYQPTEYKSFSSNPPPPNQAIAVLDGKLYLMNPMNNETSIIEFTPESAAGAGAGAEIVKFVGFVGTTIWSHSGKIFVAGSDGPATNRSVMYLDPGGNYGSLGAIRSGDDLGRVTTHWQTGKMLDHFFVVQQLSASDARHALYQVDAVSGGISVLAVNEDGDAKDEDIHSVVAYNGDVFWSTRWNATTQRVMRARADQYTKSSEVISPWHDFDLADEKVLGSLVLSVEALPADWTVHVDYAKDGSESWTNVITYSTTGGTGTKQNVSTDTSTVKFRSLSLRIRMVYTGAGVPTSGPVVRGVDANAQLAKTVTVFRLLLDLSDDKDRQGGKSGNAKLENIRAAKDLENVVSFKDGYESHTPGVFTEYDMVIDSYNIVLSTPGEGVAQVTLREPI